MEFRTRKTQPKGAATFDPFGGTPVPLLGVSAVGPYGDENRNPIDLNFIPLGRRKTNPKNGQVGHKIAKVAKNAGRVAININTEKIDNDNNTGDDPNATMDEPDVETMIVAETYAEYWPAKLKIGAKHPDTVVETASLSSVAPTDITYKLALPKTIINNGKLSAVQLESIIYASQAHEQLLPDQTRAGFLIGDGAGVGKGRTIAGIIFENYKRDRKKAIWVSVSTDLVEDSIRDLRDIDAGHIKVHNLSKLKYGKINSRSNDYIDEGVIFSTYSALISKQAANKNNSRLNQLVEWCGKNFDGCIVFDECHKAKHLVVANGEPTQTGKAVEELQMRLPKARIVYASATGASEPRNMAYMVRLGLWGEGTHFKNFAQFLEIVERRGVGAMEIVAMDMKLRGMYIARQLSFKGVTFEIQEVPFDDEFEKVYNDSVALWMEAWQDINTAIELMQMESKQYRVVLGQYWGAHQRFFKYLCIAAKIKHAVKATLDAVNDGKCVVIGLQSTGEARTLEELEIQGGKLNDFVSAAKANFESLIRKQFPAPNVPIPRKKPAKSKNENKGRTSNRNSAVTSKRKTSSTADFSLKRFKMEDDIINLDTSDESENDEKSAEKDRLSDDSDYEDSESGDLDESESNIFDLNFDDYSDSDYGRSNVSKKKIDPAKQAEIKEKQTQALQLKIKLLKKIEELGERLPTNTLDNLIDLLGGPKKVAELTGRKGRVVRTPRGIQYQSRGEDEMALDKVNLTEKARFMNGEKLIAIISEAASNGISLQSDRRAKNTRRRVHITLELPWSADRAIQQFGRTHRANQVTAPEYIFLISDLAGERRFAASVAKRLESLGALTHADRRATDTRDLSQFNVENRYGRAALRTVYSAMNRRYGPNDEALPAPKDYIGDFFSDISTALNNVGLTHRIAGTENVKGMNEKDQTDIAKFLNRILGLEVKLQNHLFKYFTDTMDAKILKAKKDGTYDMGILDMGSTDNVKLIDTKVFLRKHATGIAPIELHTVELDRGIPFEEIEKKCSVTSDKNEGFYMQELGIRKLVIFAMNAKGSTKSDEIQMQVYRPHIGLSASESLDAIRKRFSKITSTEAARYWTEQYDASLSVCAHVYWRGYCKNVSAKVGCDFGRRKQLRYMLAGSIFTVWQRIEHQINANEPETHKRLQVVRMKTAEGRKFVGVLIPKSCVEYIEEDLETDSVHSNE